MHFRNYLVAVLLAAIPVTLAQSTDLTVIKLSNTTDDTGVTRFSATSPDADVFVVKSTLPPCIARVPFYVVGSPIVIGMVVALLRCWWSTMITLAKPLVQPYVVCPTPPTWLLFPLLYSSY